MITILCKNLKKEFKTKTALKDVSLTVSAGEIFGFLGPSGSGKTTTISILTGQLDYESGTAQILGKDSHYLETSDYLDFGLMSDRLGVYDKLSLYDNLKFFVSSIVFLWHGWMIY